MRPITIFDTTLRDGEQAPGMGMNPDQKLDIARTLVELGVDVIEAGFAASSDSDAEAIRRISAEAGSAVSVASLARAADHDIEAAAAALEPAAAPRMHVFVPCSDLHIQAKLESTREAVLDAAGRGIAKARQYVDDVQFGLEDASRADRSYLVELIRTGIAAGARTVAVADTVGYLLPSEMHAFVTDLFAQVPELATVTLSVHCHDDLGMGVANSLAGLAAGASQVECTINGIGERAGNAALEEIVMALSVRVRAFDCACRVRTEKLCAASKKVADTVHLSVPPNKAVVGHNAFAHEAGIHQHGVLSNPLTYEIMTPASVGATSSRLVFGRHSGRHALQALLEQHGYQLGADQVRELLAQVKGAAGASGRVPVDDILSMARALPRRSTQRGAVAVAGS